MKKTNLKVTQRKALGRKVKKLRKKGILPANLYGKEVESRALKVDYNEFLEVYFVVGETGVVNLDIEGEKKKRPVLISQLQRDPVDGNLIHVEFRQIDLKEKVQASVPIELTGEAPAINKGGVLVQMMNEVEIEALPEELPEKLEVDVGNLEEIDQSICLNDLDIDVDKMMIIADDLKRLIVKIEEPTEEEEEEVEEPEVTLEEEIEEEFKGEEESVSDQEAPGRQKAMEKSGAEQESQN